MNEIKEAFIINKNNEPKLNRLIEQLENFNIESKIISEIDEINPLKPFIIIESDMVLENDLVKYIIGSDFEGKNVLFTKDNIDSDTTIESDKYGKVINRIKSKKNNFTNIIRIHDINNFKDNKLTFYEANINNFYFSKNDINEEIDKKQIIKSITLVDVKDLKRIEDHDKERVNILKDKILSEKYWTVPLIVEKGGYILDGHHRFEVAKLLNLTKIPAIVVDYNDVKVWSLRKEIEISSEIVKEYVDNNNIYPYKTVKHKYPFLIPDIKITLGELK